MPVGPGRLAGRRVAAQAGLGALLAAMVVTLLAVSVVRSVGTVPSWDRVLLGGDGEAFAVLARDPTLARTEVLLGQGRNPPAPVLERARREGAYRAQRPLLVYTAWAVALGRPGGVPWALAAMALLGAALASGAMAALLDRPRLAPLVVLLPGSLVALSWLSSEELALGLGLAGLAAWARGCRAPALGLLCLATLSRETLLIIPLALGAYDLARSGHRRWGATLAVAPGLLLALWVVFLRLRIGAWPIGAVKGRLGLPFVGMARDLPHWSLGDWLGVVVAGAAIALAGRWRNEPLAWVIAAHGLLAVVLGPAVWDTEKDFERVLLPLYATASVLLVQQLSVAPPARRVFSWALPHTKAVLPDAGPTPRSRDS